MGAVSVFMEQNLSVPTTLKKILEDRGRGGGRLKKKGWEGGREEGKRSCLLGVPRRAIAFLDRDLGDVSAHE
jgi:hypothetical protein